MSESNEDLVRSLSAVIDDARDLHRTLVSEYGFIEGHTAISEEGPDKECLTCGHINEAEYELAYFAAQNKLTEHL